jgi:hypothetical protein
MLPPLVVSAHENIHDFDTVFGYMIVLNFIGRVVFLDEKK